MHTKDTEAIKQCFSVVDGEETLGLFQTAADAEHYLNYIDYPLLSGEWTVPKGDGFNITVIIP